MGHACCHEDEDMGLLPGHTQEAMDLVTGWDRGSVWDRTRTDSVLVTDVLHVCSPRPGCKSVPGSGFSSSAKMSSVPCLCSCLCIICSI